MEFVTFLQENFRISVCTVVLPKRKSPVPFVVVGCDADAVSYLTLLVPNHLLS